MTTSTGPRLSLLSQTKYDHHVPDGLPAACPTLDLSATWDESAQTLLICRPPDQIVSKIYQSGRGGRATPRAVAWKPDGQFVAVGWSDGFVRLMSLENSKAAHHLQVTPASPDSEGPAPPQITRIAWVRNRVSDYSYAGPDTQPHLHSQTQPQPSSWREVLRSGPLELGAAGDDDPELDEMAKLDLPTELTFLELDTSLPKISPLPSGSAGTGGDAVVFTSRTGIEFLFQPLKREDTAQVHIMLVGTDDGSLHLSICDSFAIGTFAGSTIVSSSSAPSAPRLLAHHASHPDVSTHSLFLKSASDPSSVFLTPMDLPFVASSPVNLALLASKLTTLQKLLRYLNQAQLHMQLEYKNTRELPAKFVKGVQDDLVNATDGGPQDIMQALYHAAVTGHIVDPVKEWLVESVSDRGHKRWDKAVRSGLENLRGLVHENLLPALDRTSAILSRLRGLALFHSTPQEGNNIGFSASQLSRIADVAAALTLAGHRILLLVMEELHLFAAFSAWLRIQIDRASSTQTPDDTAQEKEASIETGKVLIYIQRFLVPTLSPLGGGGDDSTTPLGVFLAELPTEEINTASEDPLVDECAKLMDLVDAQLKHVAKSTPYHRAVPNFGFLVSLLCRRAEAMFADVAEAQKRGVKFGRSTRLAMGKRNVSDLDAAICATRREGFNGMFAETVTAMASKEHDNEIWLFTTTVHVVDGTSSPVDTLVCPVALPAGGRFLHFRFLHNNALLALFNKSKDDPTLRLLHLPLPLLRPKFIPYRDGASTPTPCVLGTDVSAGDDGQSGKLWDLALPDDPLGAKSAGPAAGGAPVRMEVRDVSDSRGRVPARVCLLSPHRTIWSTFALEELE